MKKLVRLTVVAASIVLALALALVILWKNPPRAETVDLILSDRMATDLASVRVENASGTIDIYAQDGGYVINGVPSELVDVDAFIEFMAGCASLTAKQIVQTGDLSDADFGLDAPQASVVAAFVDETGLTLRIGSQEPVSGAYYCAAEGRDEVFVIEQAAAERFFIRKEAFVSFYVTPKLNVSSPLSALGDVRFTGGELAFPVEIESVSAGGEAIKQLARSFGAATHIVRGEGVYELDQTYGLNALAPLCGLTAQAIMGYGYSESQIDEMGFAEPYMQVAFDYRNGTESATHYVLRLLPAKDDGSLFYANVKGGSVVYIIRREAFIDLSYEKLLLRWFLSPLLMDVRGISIDTGSRQYEFALDQIDPKNPAVTMNGQPLAIDAFRKLFQLLGSAANDGSYLGVQPAPTGEPLMTITYRYTEGKRDDVMALFAGEARRVNAYVNDVCEFAMKDAFVERVLQALDALESGEAFDINW